MFNLLSTILPELAETTSTPAIPVDPVNVTDSMRVAAKAIAEEMVKDPGAFAEKVIQELVQFGFKLLAAFAIYFIGAWILKKVRRTLSKILEKRGTEKTLSTFILSLVSLVLTIFLIMLTIGALGLNTTSIAAMLGAGVMAIGMALSGTMENFAGGLIILIFKPFKAGDLIATQDYLGFVTSVSIVNTNIRTFDGRSIIIPNGSISNGTVDNYSTRPYRRVDWKISVEYGTDAEACLKTLEELAKSDSRILTPETYEGEIEAPEAVFYSMEDSYIVLQLKVWVLCDQYWDVLYDMNKLIYTELPKRGFNFAFPHMDVSIKS